MRVLAPALALCAFGAAVAALINTTPADFVQPGTQPGDLDTPIFASVSCAFCHGYYDPDQEPYTRWAASLMAQSARDPVFWAALAVANKDMAGVGEFCIRCHAPGAWLAGKADPPDGSAFEPEDFDGVNCHTCHRLVDPIFDPRENPPEDKGILAELAAAPIDPHSGQMIVDPRDRRRAPRDLDESFFFHEWRKSPHHRESLMCATCHDVSNPAFTRQPDGSYALGPLDLPHPTHLKQDAFPIERTYSEWSQSDFARGPIDMGGRFGGTSPLVSTCQDCHMPTTAGVSCTPVFDPIFRSDLALHDFNGANTWVLAAVRNLHPDDETGLTAQSVADAHARTRAMLEAASDLELSQDFDRIRARVVNQTGHKLPTGFPEGRRMWINVRFFDADGRLIHEHGAYDDDSATLDVASTKVYEARLGLDAAMSALTQLHEGPSFHLVLCNRRCFDNRIPPRGFTNEGLSAVGAEPVGATYPDGQFWDDTEFKIPPGACVAETRVFYQTTTREYIEFLRDEGEDAGSIAYEQWQLGGRSEPVEMDLATLQLVIPGDVTGDCRVNQQDLAVLLADYGCRPAGGRTCPGDCDGDGDTDQSDLGVLLTFFKL